MRFGIIIVLILFCLSLLLTDNECVTVVNAQQDFEYFILIEYNKDLGDFEIASDMLDKSQCMDQLLNIECLKEQPLKKSRIERITLNIKKYEEQE